MTYSKLTVGQRRMLEAEGGRVTRSRMVSAAEGSAEPAAFIAASKEALSSQRPRGDVVADGARRDVEDRQRDLGVYAAGSPALRGGGILQRLRGFAGAIRRDWLRLAL